MEITIAILAGGASRRMGRDKALLPVPEGTLLARTAQVARETGARVVVIGRERPADWPHRDVLFAPDNHPGAGPLGGIATALAVGASPVLAIACDMPRLTVDALRWLLDTAQTDPAPWGVAPLNAGRPEPMFAVYKLAVLDEIDSRIVRGDLAVMPLLRSEQFAHPVIPNDLVETLANANTPEEWAVLAPACVPPKGKTDVVI
jgi:molybdopterin-guanine dinucleotide biosynthesis protein A